MNALLDQFLVVAAIGAAIGFFAVRWYRRRKSGACGGDCCVPGKQKARR